MNDIKISIITVCYNAADKIELTLDSVINQTYKNIEYIVIDGGSTDETGSVITRYSSYIGTYVSETDHGIYDAMNKGIRLATGDYINFMNAGDVFHTNTTVEEFVGKIDTQYDIIYGSVNKMLRDCYYLYKPFPIGQMAKKMILPHQAAFIRTSFHKAHLFDTSYRSSGDYHFFYNAYYRYDARFKEVDMVVCDYEDSTGMSKDNYKCARMEDLRIWGKEHHFPTLFKTYCWFFYRDIKNLLKYLVTADIQRKLRDMQLEKQGYKVIYNK